MKPCQRLGTGNYIFLPTCLAFISLYQIFQPETHATFIRYHTLPVFCQTDLFHRISLFLHAA